MPITTDPNDPELGHGADTAPGPQNRKYLVLPEAERAKGYVRPLRFSYKHVGAPGPEYPLRDLNEEEFKLWSRYYVKFEEYPPNPNSNKSGRFWSQEDLDKVGKGCGIVTTMHEDIAETYARQPNFYGSTYCMGCQMHLPIKEFVWVEDGERVGS